MIASRNMFGRRGASLDGASFLRCLYRRRVSGVQPCHHCGSALIDIPRLPLFCSIFYDLLAVLIHFDWKNFPELAVHLLGKELWTASRCQFDGIDD
jgi:hypothetical protein